MPDDRPACFIDTNIWLYAFIETDDVSKSLIARALIRESEPVVSTQVINEVCINLLRQANFTEEQIGRLVESFYAKCRVVELTQPVLLAASGLRQRYSLSFWDSMIVASALSAGVPVLYSEDMHHGLNIEDQLQIRNPFTVT
ncbi:MAG: PIN domain-containing protein [Anaerolineae bacterium]|nr:PIN domain-containing protein [Candidatus Roseilinea sp.]MDW8450484.1 PIN domain-containing protein [Anaerolineae bacterium]